MLLGFISALLAVVYYQNDFTTRTSANGTGPGLAWSEFKYAKGQPLAYNFRTHSVNYRTICYNWQPSQDGWIKIPYGATANDCLWSHVTDEPDPCMIFSNTTNTYYGFVSHTFRNVFSNGVVKMQFDLRAPVTLTTTGNSAWCWVRPLMYECATTPATGGGYVPVFPIELGIAGTELSGGWRTSESAADGTRDYQSYGRTTAGHWYRHYVTFYLDSDKADIEVYDLGTVRIAMDATPTGSALVTKKNCYFRYNNNGERVGGKNYRGYLNGMSFNLQKVDTLKSYGEEGFNSDYAIMIDNIKGSWQPPSGGSFVEFYRNDFTTSRRRTVDGSIDPTSHKFAYDEPVVVTNVYTIYNDKENKGRFSIERPAGSLGPSTVPYLTGVYNKKTDEAGKAVAQLQEPGADGWRLAGDPSLTTPVFVVPDVDGEDGNNMIGCTSYGKNIQPMCEEITSGKVRFEFDQRMPDKWIQTTKRSEVDLISQAAWETGTSLNGDCLTRCGCIGTNETSAFACLGGIRTSDGKSALWTIDDTPLKNSTWYRFRQDVDLDAGTVTYYVYEIGASAPAKPDGFVPSAANLKLSRDYKLLQPSGSGYRDGIAAWGLSNWQTAQTANGAMLLDNIRLWKLNSDGSLGDLVFCNDGYNTTRVFTKARKALWDEEKMLIDRPEYAEDGIIVVPTYCKPNYITGSNHAAQFSDTSYLGMTIPLGCTVRSGILRAQYDVRLANNTDYGNTCMVCLGGAQLGSASELGTGFPQRFNTGYAIGTGIIATDKTVAENGVHSRFHCYYEVGDRNGHVPTGYAPEITTSKGWTNGKWVRVKIVADVDAQKYDVSFYDMGSTHPSFDTPDGTLITSNGTRELPFRWVTDPISHMYIFGGRTPSYAPWLEDAPGACLIDNIRVSRDDRGLVIILN